VLKRLINFGKKSSEKNGIADPENGELSDVYRRNPLAE
jgi:hypothetical protein